MVTQSDSDVRTWRAAGIGDSKLAEIRYPVVLKSYASTHANRRIRGDVCGGEINQTNGKRSRVIANRADRRYEPPRPRPSGPTVFKPKLWLMDRHAIT